jgi:hypothetical protein
MHFHAIHTHRQQHEAFLLVAQMSHFAAGVALARSGHAIAATLVLAVAHTTCGWLAHDYMHGRCVSVTLVTLVYTTISNQYDSSLYSDASITVWLC